MLSIHIDYPAHADEVDIAARSLRAKWDGFTPLVRKEEFYKFTEIVDQMPVSRHVLECAVALTTASRPKDAGADEYVRRLRGLGRRPARDATSRHRRQGLRLAGWSPNPGSR